MKRLAIVAVGLGGMAMGQVAPPPPAPPEPKPEYVRPVVPPTPPTVQRRTRPDVRDIDFESLIERDDRGMIKHLNVPVDYAALDHNPLIGPEQREKVDAWMVDRKKAMEKLVVEYADVAVEVDAGILNDLVISDQLAMEAQMELLKPLQLVTTLGDEMRASKVLSPEQAELNNYIANQYTSARIDELRDTFVPDEDSGVTLVDMILRYVFSNQVAEPMYAYHNLLLEGAPRIDELVGKIEGVAPETVAKVRELAEKYDPDAPRDKQLDVMKQIVEQLEMAEVRDLLQAVIDSRKD